MKKRVKSLIIYSGGLDSTVCLYLALSQKESVEAISFYYHQKHKIELNKARAITKQLNIPHRIVQLPSEIFSSSALVNEDLQVPSFQENKRKIPSTYVPARNLLFLSFALSYAEAHKMEKIYIGVNALDYSGYPDCRPEFIKAFQETSQLATKVGNEGHPIQIATPLINMTKKEIIELGLKLGVPFRKTHSCYSPQKGKPCGKCESCVLRKKGFEEAGILDA
ncbi:MAG: 7-cyano-7-deazaguanine synthase QueC [Leptospiraceae bacterium]|nr:7-cyano-7-deazaguanine synthase QueC [Leptospiraceae bacterium]